VLLTRRLDINLLLGHVESPFELAENLRTVADQLRGTNYAADNCAVAGCDILNLLLFLKRRLDVRLFLDVRHDKSPDLQALGHKSEREGLGLVTPNSMHV
jgi:hypothetical protein